ncbi:type IV pilus twitching motility protein PilT [Deinococcus cellulosilyticus]|uniref:Twitching motility protein PilT n=1 Tax=Deinococcus cellulosilyticus (strain DSM 18568 / NBRC 106333 / KACC 11606 / 5516J-15) TaxID=1223518 RepID=A0A511N624_DEIC1|nr:PilT/PilU family type 4a pilus ATPase [Deinococcus cellulosilyticus]GEM47861.1 twitching motility protein PilT [Deinococcus cellulosilyticus NBRC 106333 = KACC 11606]
MQSIQELLTHCVALGASDIHLRAKARPMVRIDGDMQRIGEEEISPELMEEYCKALMVRPGMWQEFVEKRDADFAYGISGVSRFRVNAFWQRGTVGLIMRVVQSKEIPTFSDLGLNATTFADLCSKERGLILVTGPTGSGKTTTLASMLDYINQTAPVNVVTLEDPIEVLHRDKMASINQRELGLDTLSFAAGLRAAMRQDPDVILIGEMRDKETVEAALSAAQTGHLVFSTLHTLDAIRTVNRIIDFFAPHERGQIRMGLSESLVGVVSQRLLPRKGGGRVLGLEVMVGTPTVRECVKDEDKLEQIKDALMEGEQIGMHTFDQHLAKLVRDDLLTRDAALEAATSPHELRMMIDFF